MRGSWPTWQIGHSAVSRKPPMTRAPGTAGLTPGAGIGAAGGARLEERVQVGPTNPNPLAGCLLAQREARPGRSNS